MTAGDGPEGEPSAGAGAPGRTPAAVAAAESRAARKRAGSTRPGVRARRVRHVVPVVVLAAACAALLIALLAGAGVRGEDAGTGAASTPVPVPTVTVTVTPVPSASSAPVSPVALPRITTSGTLVTDHGTWEKVELEKPVFEQGKAELSKWGQKTLRKVAVQFTERAGDDVAMIVVGDAGAAPGAYGGEASLGMSRAVAVIRFMHDETGLPYDRVSAATTRAGSGQDRSVVLKLVPLQKSF